jgi:hypothetical protein
MGLAVGTAVLAILPLWSARTTGDWRVSPVAVYMRDYMPFDRPHFGYDSTAPRRTPPPDLAFVNASLDSVQRAHTLAAVPQIARERWRFLAMQSWWEPIPQTGFALLGLVLAPAAALVGAVTALIVFVGYLAHPTWPSWTIYYMEIAPVLAFYAVCGFAVVLRALAREPERAWEWARNALYMIDKHDALEVTLYLMVCRRRLSLDTANQIAIEHAAHASSTPHLVAELQRLAKEQFRAVVAAAP